MKSYETFVSGKGFTHRVCCPFWSHDTTPQSDWVLSQKYRVRGASGALKAAKQTVPPTTIGYKIFPQHTLWPGYTYTQAFGYSRRGALLRCHILQTFKAINYCILIPAPFPSDHFPSDHFPSPPSPLLAFPLHRPAASS